MPHTDCYRVIYETNYSIQHRHCGERTGCRFLRSTTLITDHTIRQPGFDLLRRTRSLLNGFQIVQGPCRANMHKWGLAQSPSCDCDQRQTMNHISINKIWRRTECTPRSRWQHSHMAGIHSNCSTQEMKLQHHQLYVHKAQHNIHNKQWNTLCKMFSYLHNTYRNTLASYNLHDLTADLTGTRNRSEEVIKGKCSSMIVRS